MSINDPMLRAAVRVVAFPTLFQAALITFAWGTGDDTWLLIAKRVFLLLPVCAVLVACWATVLSVVSIPIRSARHEFTTALFVTWWDLGKSVLSFWGGLFRFVVELLLATLAVARVAAFAVWALIHDVLMLPFAFLRHVAGNVVRSPIPWIAVSLTLAWCVIETTIFTYVMTPVVIDTFSNITGETFKESFVRVPLFLFLFFVVLGSYAVLSTFVDAIKSRSIQQIAGILNREPLRSCGCTFVLDMTGCRHDWWRDRPPRRTPAARSSTNGWWLRRSGSRSSSRSASSPAAGGSPETKASRR